MQYPTMSEYVKASQDAGDNLDMSTEATNAELDEAIMDEFGAKYSQDGRKLLKAPKELDGTYSIRKETKIICDCAFKRGGEHSPPLPFCLSFTDVHDIEMVFLSYISIEIEIISND